MKEFLTKKYGDLPGWAWLLIGIAGIGAGILLIRWQKSKTSAASAGLTANPTPDLTTGNASGTESNPATGTVASNGIIDNPFPETNVGGNQIPIIPPGYQAMYDQNGNIVGFEPIPPAPAPAPPPTTPAPPPTTPAPPTVHQPGTTFLGPTGVIHYVTTGQENLSQIAQKFGLQSWNSIYAIPDNQRLFGRLDATHARVYTPTRDMTITLPPGTAVNPPLVPLTAVRRRAA